MDNIQEQFTVGQILNEMAYDTYIPENCSFHTEETNVVGSHFGQQQEQQQGVDLNNNLLDNTGR